METPSLSILKQWRTRKDESLVFPGMQKIVTDEKEDTVMRQNDLYLNYSDRIGTAPLKLQSNLTVAPPLHSNQNYTANIFYLGLMN